MKNLIGVALVIFFALGLNPVNAQEKLSKKEQRKIEKREQKKEEKELLKRYKEAYYKIARDSSFLIEANILATNNNMNTFMVNNDLNFFKIDGDRFVLQTSSNIRMGQNGLGGITIEGRVLDYEVKKGKGEKPITINADVMSTVMGHSIVNIIIHANGQGMARVTDNRGNDITFRGDTYSLDGVSTAFEGQPLF
ncbi:MAG: DUF4251 domain-containing protein [Candidatus Cyclobacteriaceae bacterium M2_1C_046]